MKHQGTRNDLETTSRQVVGKLEAADTIGEQTGESGRQVQRFIRLTNLIPEILDMVDEKKIAFNPAVELSYLKPSEQKEFLEAMDYAQASPSLSQAQRLKKLSQEGGCTLDAVSYTHLDVYKRQIPLEVIAFLDPTIEKLCFEQTEGKTFIHLKFKDEEEIILNNAADLEQYLSSGTIKGIITFSMVKEVLHSGGYLLVDEIENHFNKEIVTTLVRFFMDSRLNKNGGTLIFTTHYPELLDEYDRNDGICIVRNRNGITAENLSYILKRNDIKKSDAYQSGFLEGTTPAYEAYMRLKKSLAASIN